LLRFLPNPHFGPSETDNSQLFVFARSMDQLNKVVLLNNESVSLLQSGTDEKAVFLMIEALTILRKLLIVEDADTLPNQDGLGTCSHGTLNSLAQPTFYASESLSRLPEHCNFVYNNVFRLSPLEMIGSGSVRAYIACVIYNLAVIHQRRGMLFVDPLCLEKAARFYHTCLTFLGHSLPNVCSGTSLLLKLVTLNNLSQIHYQREQFERAHDDLASLASLLGGAIQEDVCDMFTDQEWEGLMANVMLLQPPTVAAAA
jgi:hypothetical protein